MAKKKFSAIKVRSFEIQEFFLTELEVDIAISAFQTYIQSSEQNLRTIDKEFKESIEKDEYLNSDEPGLFKVDYYQQSFETEERTIDYLKYLQRNSIFLTGYAFFESKLREICQLAEKKVEKPVKIDDLKGDSIGQYWSYINKVIEIRKEDKLQLEKHYTPLKQLKELRNKAAHEGNSITEKQKELSSQIKGIRIEHSKYFIEDLAFFENFFKNLEKFFSLLIIAIDDRLKEEKEKLTKNKTN